MAASPPPSPARSRTLAWAAGVAACALATLLAAERHARGSRLLLEVPPELAGTAAFAVRDAGHALELWRVAGVRGRRLVLLTGQWSRPGARPAEPGATGPSEPSRPRDPPVGEEVVDARGALFAAARIGIVRGMDVVMPGLAFGRRLADVAGQKELRRGEGSFELDLNGVQRRFSTPRAFIPPEEPVLVLVEPTWFADGAPPDPLAWLAAWGVRTDLALVALADPMSGEDERRAAEEYARSARLPFVEASE